MSSVVRSTDAPVSAEHLALALEAAEMGTWEWNIREGRVFWSPALERMHGLPDGSFPGTFEAYQQDIHPDDRAHVLATIERTVRDRQPHRLDYRIVLPDGRVRWLEARGRLLVDEQGQPARLVGVCMDVTERRERDAAWSEALAWRRRAEEELAHQQRLASLVRDVGLALTQIADKPAMLQACAQAVVDHLGAAFARIWTFNEAEQVLELRASAGMYTHLDGPHGRVPIGRFKIGAIAQQRVPHLTNDVAGDPLVGDEEWARREGLVAFAGYPLVFGRTLIGVLAMFARHELRDDDFTALATVANAVTVGVARARADMAIRQSEERYRFLAEAAPTQVWTATAEGRLEFANTLTHEYFGTDVAELSPEGQQALVHPDDREAVDAAWASAFTSGSPLEIEYRLRRHDGEYRWHLVRARPFRDILGRVVRWFGTNTDIHEPKTIRLTLAKRAEELALLATALQRSNQELDQFAYVASHDLKAPLRGIANLSQWLEEDLGEAVDEQAREHLALLRSRVNRMEALIEGILQYSRAGRTSAPPEQVAVRRLLGEVVDLLQPPGPPAVVQIDLAEDLPVIRTEKLPLQQVFLNLLSNALKHAGSVPEPRVKVEWRREGETDTFTVTDNGPGIAPAYHDRIWGIFQTLQPRDKVEGTGIGLALVKKIVEGRGGRIWIDSAEGAGATFGFTWPLHGREPV